MRSSHKRMPGPAWLLAAGLAMSAIAPAWAADPVEPAPPAKTEAPAAKAETPAANAEAPAPAAEAAPAAAEPAPVPATAYSEKGADTCRRCHDEEDAKVQVLFKTKHGVKGDPNSPFAQLQCENCHGPGGRHAQKSSEPIGLFGKNSPGTVTQQNEACLSCHSTSNRVGWHGSIHERRDLACVSCHKIHAEHDPVRDRAEQPGVCYQCHGDIRAAFNQFSAHPVRYAEMTCTSCHQPHDSLFPALLAKPTVNQTCNSCHAQYRGPFLWEHPPVAENCNNCHNAHGSTNPSLLTLRPPLLCQQCHSSAGHPSIAYTGQGLPGRTPSATLLGGSCLNCHSHVHGSNAPSGADLSR